MKSILLKAIFVVCVVQYSQAQFDAHYWTHQYGAKGLLLNGAVIASADDETNIYYNPGAMGLDDNLGFAFSFLSPTYARIAANNFLGDQSQLVDEGFDFSPGFLAVRFSPVNKLTIGIASFERFKSNIRFQDRVAGPVNDTGAFLLRADLDFERRISEEWFAIGLSYNITDNLGIGITQFSAWHDQNLNLLLKKEVLLSSTPQVVSGSWRNEFSYGISTYSGFISKLGLSYSADNFKLGLTYTSPTYGILRSSVSYAIDDQRINPFDQDITTVSNRDETDLLNYKTPHAFGFGMEIKDGKTIYSVSAEYFTKIDNYILFKERDDAFDGQSQGDAFTTISLNTGNENVINFAFGMQFQRSEKLTWVAGFRTDFNENTSLQINEIAEYLGTTPSVYHISGGAMYKTGKNTFSLGVDIGYGSSMGGQALADFDNVSLDNLFEFSGGNNVDTDFISVMLFLTYDFIFQNISTKKDEDR